MAKTLIPFMIMASGKSKSHVWECPKCGSKVTLHVNATEVVCANKQTHTSTTVRMEERGKTKVA